jgi:hypothetical protein
MEKGYRIHSNVRNNRWFLGDGGSGNKLPASQLNDDSTKINRYKNLKRYNYVI